MYEYILTRFGCPLTIVIDQGIHFINDTIKHLTKYFMLKHISSTTCYPQAESTNKIIGRLLTKLVNEKRTD
jgi:hypothetical protein